MAKPNAKKKPAKASKSAPKKKAAVKKAVKKTAKVTPKKKLLKKKVKAKPKPTKKPSKPAKKIAAKAAKPKKATKPARKAPPKAAKPTAKKVTPATKAAPKAAPTPKPAAPVVIHQGLTGAMPLAVVTHYYDKIGVATLKLMGTMRMGDRIRVTRGEVSFEQDVHSLQIGGNPVQGGIAGQDVAMKLDQAAHEGARVYKA